MEKYSSEFSIFGTIGQEISNFKQDKISIAGNDNTEEARYLHKNSRGYMFSQWDVLNLIDLYYNSKFETGQIDSEGQRKLFLNICAFRADVASKMIDLDTKDFIFIPDDESSKWLSYFISKEFKDWARQNYFGELINEFVERYPKYGTVVSKKVGKEIRSVPLRSLINQQDAKDLKTATHVIELHENMTLADMQEYPDWDTEGLEMEYGDTETVYERYGCVPKKWFEKETGHKSSTKGDTVEAVVICVLTERKGRKNTEYSGTVLFCEEVPQKDRPYQEAHWKRQDGRWLGIGEVENLFENQVSRNMIANLRRRALLWSSKKLFQSPDDTIAKNLIRDVKDGDVIRIMPNGNITQVDMASREIGEFQSTEQIWEENSNQKSFTYDAATGDTPPSGTPFRLQVLVNNAVASHFQMKREKLGIFFKKLIVEDVYDIFKRENSKAHTITIFGTEDGMNDLRKVAATVELNKRILDWALSDSLEIPNFELWKQITEESYQQQSHLFVEIPDKAYDDVKHHVELTITGEEIDTRSEIDSLTPIWQTMTQTGDPRAEQVLSRIMFLTGKNLEAMLGPKPPPPQQMQQQQQAQQQPQIAQPQIMPQAQTV